MVVNRMNNMFSNPRQMLDSMLKQNPQIASSPNAQEWIKIIQSGDSTKCQEVVQNLSKSWGMTPQQMLQSAKQYLNFPF